MKATGLQWSLRTAHDPEVLRSNAPVEPALYCSDRGHHTQSSAAVQIHPSDQWAVKTALKHNK
jgi:hypothetical protein